MKNKQDFEMLLEFREKCRDNRAFPDCELLTRFAQKFDSLEYILSKGEIIYRSRVYYNDMVDRIFSLDLNLDIKDDKDIVRLQKTIDKLSELQKDFDTKRQKGFYGYDEKDSFVNPNNMTVLDGRCNYAYSPCLYASQDIDTAICELKPLIREKISVAEIEVLQDLKLIDLRFNKHKDFIDLIALLFIESPTINQKDVCIYTQIITAFVKKQGYDGIVYTSCQNILGTNYAIFNYEKCKPISSEVYNIEQINIKYTKEDTDRQLSLM